MYLFIFPDDTLGSMVIGSWFIWQEVMSPELALAAFSLWGLVLGFWAQTCSELTGASPSAAR